jgi:formylglycine-generating enzyme required for sulfatase activity
MGHRAKNQASRAVRALLALAAVLPLPAQNAAPPKHGTQIEFVKLAPGEFTMGCSDNDKDCADDEKPARRVQIAKAFEIGKYEVTQAQWEAVMGSNPSTIKGPDRPVETVSRDDAKAFLEKLNARNDGYGYRLPTEEEWEYAARAGGAKSPPIDEMAWYDGNSEDETHDVGLKKPNAWGIHDMLGNVREWVDSLFTGNGPRGNRQAADFEPQAGREPPPQPPDADGPPPPPPGRGFGRGGRGGFGRGGRGRGGRGGMRELPVVRGGAWDNPASFVRLSARYHYYGPTLRVSDIGFRAVREAK